MKMDQTSTVAALLREIPRILRWLFPGFIVLTLCKFSDRGFGAYYPLSNLETTEYLVALPFIGTLVYVIHRILWWFVDELQFRRRGVTCWEFFRTRYDPTNVRITGYMEYRWSIVHACLMVSELLLFFSFVCHKGSTVCIYRGLIRCIAIILFVLSSWLFWYLNHIELWHFGFRGRQHSQRWNRFLKRIGVTPLTEPPAAQPEENRPGDGSTRELDLDDVDESIGTVWAYIEWVNKTFRSWSESGGPVLGWFRGQPVDKPLLPKLLRQTYDENNLVQFFRMRAPVLGTTPPRDQFDKWLFLMQHSGLPTRLLDWTEGALIALFFAVRDVDKVPLSEFQPVVWMVDPIKLNALTLGPHAGLQLSMMHSTRYDKKTEEEIKAIKANLPDPPDPRDPNSSLLENIRLAFEQGGHYGRQLPEVAYPTYVHARMAAQMSCFTVHGTCDDSIEKMFRDTLMAKGRLTKCTINPEAASDIMIVLRTLGISYSTLFPEFDGLANELTGIFAT